MVKDKKEIILTLSILTLSTLTCKASTANKLFSPNQSNCYVCSLKLAVKGRVVGGSRGLLPVHSSSQMTCALRR